MASFDRMAARTARASLRTFGEDCQLLRLQVVKANPDTDPATLTEPVRAIVKHDVERSDSEGFVIRVTEMTASVNDDLKKGDVITEAAGREWTLSERVKNDNHLVTWTGIK
ncbi:hypothetical protein [Parendozoicomonas sp. Alg238-R29]|uniref:hypothetical protein n=1 Tax=Parendozoicomonas sp. Alg238-R29 TaxID=2993446 RepID=UPI00248D4099|nr:hypothetical protein [Parendozoicomonas sp. Alg238-R29]